MIRAVVDPGVFIAGTISDVGAPASLLRAWLAGAIELVVSPMLLEELRRALGYPKLRRLVPPDVAEGLATTLEQAGLNLPDPIDTPSVCRDPHDDYLFALAAEAGAILVSGDRESLDVDSPHVRVLSPRALASVLDPHPE